MDIDKYTQLARWYKNVTWFGIFLNSLFIFPLLFAPSFFLKLLGLSADPIIWAMLPGMLLLWISVFYIPASLNLKKYRVMAWLAIFPSRVGGATFCISAVVFFDQPLGFLSIGLVDLFILLWQLRILMKVRAVENPPPASAKAEKSRKRRKWFGVFAILLIVLGATAWYKFFREIDQQFASMEEYFKYGSIGSENAQGSPYWIWLTLPRIFPEYLPGPGGYNSLGLHSEAGKSVPVGFSVKTIGFARVGINCAICHTASVRMSANELPILLPAGGTSTFDALGYQRFLFKSASDPRFNADTILGEIDKMYKLSFIDSLLYRYLLVPATKKALLAQKDVYAWTDSRPYWGRGRIDPFNPVKSGLLHVDVGDTIGNSDMMPIWNLGARKNMAFHWDGLNTDITEVVRSSALGDGATAKSIPLHDLQKLQDWLTDLKPPKYPVDRFPIDKALVAAGESVFNRECADCHAYSGTKTGQVIPVDQVGTDPHRVKIWTPQAAEAYNAYAKGYAWKFSHFRSTNGYVAVTLDGLWTRAPFLHNGSVPTLRDLLEPPQNRPKVFYRGYDVLDPKNVGFVSQGADAQRTGFRYDTAVTGNSNQGHEWGTALSTKDKESLVEYLKTL